MNLTVPLVVNLDEDKLKFLIEEAINNIKAKEFKIIQCKNCCIRHTINCPMRFDDMDWTEDSGFCHIGKEKM